MNFLLFDLYKDYYNTKRLMYIEELSTLQRIVIKKIIVKQESDEENKLLSKITHEYLISILNTGDLIKGNLRKDMTKPLFIPNYITDTEETITRNSRNQALKIVETTNLLQSMIYKKHQN